MRVQRRTVNVLLLSKQEIGLLMQMVDEAKNGQTVHYSERQTGPGQFFGVSVDEGHDEKYRQPPVKREPSRVDDGF